MGHILSRIKEELVRLDTRRCTIETEGFGTMVFELYPEYAPITVESFKKLSDEGFYDGLCWCRIVKDYVIQGGLPDQRYHGRVRLAYQRGISGKRCG